MQQNPAASVARDPAGTPVQATHPAAGRGLPLDALIIAAYFFAGPLFLLLDHVTGITVADRGPVTVRTLLIYGLASPLVGYLLARRHARARFALYVFATMEILRGLLDAEPVVVTIAAAVVLYVQTPRMRRLFPRLSAGLVWERLRARAIRIRDLVAGARPVADGAAPTDVPVPGLVSWNLTAACNLRCPHCYLDAGAPLEGELSTPEAFDLIDELSRMGTEMLILTGGEPLLRKDLLALVRRASDAGLHVVLGTNGVLLDEAMAKRLAEAGLQGVGLSLDSIRAEPHDAFRGLVGAWERTRRAISACREEGLPVVIQSTLTEWNHQELPALVQLSRDAGAAAFNAYALVCTGRGERLSGIGPEQYERSLAWLIEEQSASDHPMMLRAKCAPHAARIACEMDSPLGGSAGCLAGKSYLRIGPRGEVTPCPYMPSVVGNVRDGGLEPLWRSAELFASLREGPLGGRCGLCEYRTLCGGCRARALAMEGDALAEDPWCRHEPTLTKPREAPVTWTPAARERLGKVPTFIRTRLEKGLEAHARRRGLATVTPELMAEVRREAGWPGARGPVGGGSVSTATTTEPAEALCSSSAAESRREEE